MAGVYAHEHLASERSPEEIAVPRICRLRLGEKAQTDLLTDDSMILSKRYGLAVPDQVASRIADMGYNRLIIAESADNNGSRYRNPSWTNGTPFFINFMIRRLYQTAEQRQMRFPTERLAKISEQTLHCETGCNLAEILSAYAIGDHKEPPV